MLQSQALTPTFRNRSPTMLSADILAEGVRGLVPNPFGIAANTDTYYMLYSSMVPFFKINLNKLTST